MTRYLPLTDQDPPRLGPYRLVGRIGRGGQATVYYGVDTTGRDAEAAVKVLHVDWGDHQERRHVLERELRNDHLTPAVDLFAWGATMIYAATGRHAFPGDTAQAVMFRVVDSPPQLYDIEEPVRALVARCLAKDPRRRPTAAQAKRLLVGQAPRPRKFTPGVASSGPAGAAKAPAPTKVGPVLAGPGTAGVAAPVVLAPADSPRPWPRPVQR